MYTVEQANFSIHENLTPVFLILDETGKTVAVAESNIAYPHNTKITALYFTQKQHAQDFANALNLGSNETLIQKYEDIPEALPADDDDKPLLKALMVGSIFQVEKSVQEINKDPYKAYYINPGCTYVVTSLNKTDDNKILFTTSSLLRKPWNDHMNHCVFHNANFLWDDQNMEIIGHLEEKKTEIPKQTPPPGTSFQVNIPVFSTNKTPQQAVGREVLYPEYKYVINTSNEKGEITVGRISPTPQEIPGIFKWNENFITNKPNQECPPPGTTFQVTQYLPDISFKVTDAAKSVPPIPGYVLLPNCTYKIVATSGKNQFTVAVFSPSNPDHTHHIIATFVWDNNVCKIIAQPQPQPMPPTIQVGSIVRSVNHEMTGNLNKGHLFRHYYYAVSQILFNENKQTTFLLTNPLNKTDGKFKIGTKGNIPDVFSFNPEEDNKLRIIGLLDPEELSKLSKI